MSIDRLITEFDRGLRTIFDIVSASRPSPEKNVKQEVTMTSTEKKYVTSLMRINHVGEICAQALYRAQALTARSQKLVTFFLNSAQEEEDHLAWTTQRIKSLNGRKSFLNPFWYGGAFCIGMFVGCLGDEASLSFMAETERQVQNHLEKHLQNLPLSDHISKAVLKQMCIDEKNHYTDAILSGAKEVPISIQYLMYIHAEAMRLIAYYI